jgi:DNA-binding NtrC family response regulator
MNSTDLQAIKRRYNIVGNCDGLNHALNVALQVANTDLSVLIVGESGVGKEIIPRLIHDQSPRKRGNYFAINCGSIPEGTIDSELFGHEKGSFTDAINESKGYFGVADKGTLFLDEVGELPMATQARLLRVLETGEYIRVGGQKVLKTDVRIVAATNLNIRKAISEGRFREDLYYRLNTIPIHIPPLRDRGRDILLLFKLFAMQIAERYQLPRITLTEDAERLMLKYKWPGNVRQLKNLTEQISILSENRVITAETLSEFISDDGDTTLPALVAPNSKSRYDSEREIIFEMLKRMQTTMENMGHELASLRNQINNKPLHPAGQLLKGYSGHHTEIEDAQVVEINDSDPEPEDDESLNENDVKRQMTIKALERNNGNREKAASELGISTRTLYRRIKDYGLDKK